MAVLRLVPVNVGTVALTAHPMYYLCDTTAELPNSGLKLGDTALAKDTNLQYKAASATTWTPISTTAGTTPGMAIFQSDPAGALTVQVGAGRWYNRTGRTLSIAEVFGFVRVAPAGASVLVDVNVNGTTIWSTQGNRLAITAGSQTGVQSTFNTTTIASGSYLSADIDQVGSTTSGSDLAIYVTLSG